MLFLLACGSGGSSSVAETNDTPEPPTMACSVCIYVSDAGNFSSPPWQILKYNLDGSTPQTFINSNLSWPQDILFLDDQNIVLISNLSSGTITKHDADSGAYLGDFATGISEPTRMKIGPDNLIYVLQWDTDNKVIRFSQDGTALGDFTSIGVNRSIGIDWDLEGNLYISSYNGGFVQKFNTLGDDMGPFVDANLQGPTNIWFDADGDLLVVDYDGGAVKRFDQNGNYISEFISGLNRPEGVAFFENGDIAIGNGGTNSVKLYSSNGSYIKDIISSGSGGLLTPNAIVIR